MNATKDKYGHVVCTYLHDGRRYRQHYLAVSYREEGKFFWSRCPDRAATFEAEDDAREVARVQVEAGYWIAKKLL